jgi:transposase
VTSVIMAVVHAVHGHDGEVTGLVQPTQSQDLKFINEDGTALLGLDGLGLLRVDLVQDGARVVHVVTTDERAAACPTCGVISTALKGSATTRPRDVTYGPDAIGLVWHKSRWRCREPRCPRVSFTESLPQVPPRCRLTTRLCEQVGAGVADGYACVSSAARAHGVSWPVAHAAFVAHVTPILEQDLSDVAVLGIDETRRGKPIWGQDRLTGRWTVVHDRWHTAIVDASGTTGLLAHIDGRTAAAVAQWLAGQPDTWRTAVTHVTIDLSASYAKAVRDALPGAVIVVDKFHLVALGNQMVTEVRQHATRAARGRRGRKKDPEWAARRRLLLGYERHTSDSFTRMWNALVDAGDPGIEVLHAYVVKERLRDLLALPTTADRELIAHRLHQFYEQAAASELPEAHRLAQTIEAWWPAVLAAITTGYSNARSEGYNRLAKHVGRDAFGFRNPVNQRRRIRWHCTRQHRRLSAKKTVLPG